MNFFYSDFLLILFFLKVLLECFAKNQWFSYCTKNEISSVSVTKPQFSEDFIAFTEKILNGKRSVLYIVEI